MRRRAFAVTAFAVLLTFAAAWTDAAFLHEDDGCAVERHCLACRWSAGTTSVVAAGPAVPVMLALSQPTPADPVPPVLDAAGRAPTSRGPPPSSSSR